MRVLCLSPYLPPPLGGIEKEMLAVAAELVAMDHAVSIVATTARFPSGDNPVADPVAAGIRVRRLPGYWRSTLRGFAPARPPLVVPGLVAAARGERPDSVLVFNLGWGPPLRPVLRALAGVAPVLFRTYYHPPGGRLRPLKRRYLLATVGLADRALVATRGERDDLIAGGLAPAAVAVVPPGVHVHPADPDLVASERERHALAGKTVVAHVARLSRFKGTEDLIEVLGDVRRRTGRDVVLLLIGADHSDGNLARLAEARGVAPHVRLVGEIRDDRRLRALLANAAVFALPSEYEAFGIAYIEALAEGVPCVGCDVGGVRDAIGPDGVIVPRFGDRGGLTDALVSLIADEPRRRALGAAGRERVLSSLTWRYVAERMVAIGEAVAAGRR